MKWNLKGQLLSGLSIGALLCSGALSGCSSGGSQASLPATTSLGTPVNTTSADSQPEESEATEIDDIPRTDLSQERAVDWQRYELIDEHRIRVFFSAGSKSCYGTRAVVEETESTVEIAVIEGRLPGAPDVCTLIARQASILVETSQPVGDREVIPLANPVLNQ
jgi:hypothetical protein